jgi:2,4-dienoyl-CoA reductase-like NADH-dependent reductase (Old Yellow Enzyme family)
MNITKELVLPCGAIIKNRIGKSAMSENMGTKDLKSNQSFVNVYEMWASGGSGLLITGNVMIDSNALGEPRNVVIEKGLDHNHLKAWANAGKKNNTHIWTQLNHPGKQSPKFLSPLPVSPSAIGLRPPLDRMFNKPRALSEAEIQDIILRFGYAAKISKEVGFTGVQIHGAHGYLVSQFLSPLHNQRNDKWGGSLENRMRFVHEIYDAIRREVGPGFPIGIKLNSADFQRGGFTNEESMDVIESLSKRGMDLIEVSGGTYEAPEMTGVRHKNSTREREAYFIDYCEKIRSRVKTPLMLTGGFRSIEGMESTLESGACDVIGLARSLAINPQFPNQLFAGQNSVSEVKQLTTGIKAIDKIVPIEITWYTDQIHRMGRGLSPDKNLSVKGSVLRTIMSMGLQGLKRVRAK